MRRVLLWLALLLCAASPAFAQVSISNLPQASTLVGSEPLPVVQNGVTRKATVSAVGSPRGYIDGLTLSTAGSSIVFSVAPGVATDSTGLYRITVPSTLTKTTAAWAQGVGGCLDTGAIANSTWYHVFAIENVSTGVADALCSTSASAPAMPSGWVAQRRIGSMVTNGSGQWTGFLQKGNEFWWLAPVRNVSTTPTNGATNTVQLSVPINVSNLKAIVTANTTYTSGSTTQLFVWDPTLSAALSNPAITVSTLAGLASDTSPVGVDTSANVKTQLNYGTAVIYYIDTRGWIDPRGKDS